MSKDQDVTFIKSDYMDHIDTHTQINSLPGKVMIKPIRNSKFLSLKLKNDEPENNNTLLGCLFRSILRLGHTPHIRIEKAIGKSLFGQDDGLIVSSKI
jgi:hypothetical protein